LTFGLPADILNFMVEQYALDSVFRAVADPTRRAMLRSLAAGERNIGQLAQPFSMSFAAASKHVKVLEGAGLVRRHVRGREHICRIEARPLAAADKWLRDFEGFWNDQLGGLEALLREEDQTSARDPEGETP
jgi:DNA-binding transcriptional ArsR family regulator